MDISVMFFGADNVGGVGHATKYTEILDIARAADRLGFTAVWTPERHFQQVGQVFPNPSVLSAALAVATERIAIRAGSLVLPLHHPLRVVEDWAVVDNLSRGRIGLSVATGWHSKDFVLAPERFAGRREHALDGIELLRRLWSGEEVEFTDGSGRPVAVRPQPTPYSPELPLWLTTSGSPQTWRTAGRLRTNVLAATIGQTREELAGRIALYRELHPKGTVTLMAHTHVADDAARTVGEPLKAYLKSYVAQTATNRLDDGRAARLTERESDALAEFALRRYLNWGGLLGPAERCREFLTDLSDLGVDEVACFVDFGLPAEQVLAGLERLSTLMTEAP
ncbi:MupA/Atu3671 family FMN-dependent luciferase-like monooxygenase [Streptosporangium sp. NPDC020072]|uniref:MupA/Atu3671 family FMN-dependent luciferase-like monooxygenase n=1 Tax=unclassified Streptosporangium TaxID=2632669 RepID=UPI003439F05A